MQKALRRYTDIVELDDNMGILLCGEGELIILRARIASLSVG